MTDDEAQFTEDDPKVTIRELFDGLQTEMAIRLSSSRDVIQHPVAKGTVSEQSWIRLLRKYLPKRYKVDSAFILDSHGAISEQIDIVIFDRQYSTFLLNRAGVKFIPAESVYAVFEVKQVLDTVAVKAADDKARSVHALVRTNERIVQAGGIIQNPREPKDIITGVLTTINDWAPPFGQTFRDNLNACTTRIDLGCVINSGAFVWDKTTEDYRVSEPNSALVSFYFSLLQALQQMGTVPAIEFDKYLEILDQV